MSIEKNNIRNSKNRMGEREKLTFSNLLSCYMYNIKQLIFNPNYKYGNLKEEIIFFLSKKLSRESVLCNLDIVQRNNNMVEIEIAGSQFFVPANVNLDALRADYHAIIGNIYHPHHYERYGVKVNDGDVVIDAGACEGFFTNYAWKKASKVYSFEPIAEMYNCLLKTFSNRKNVVIENFALSNKNGTINCAWNNDYLGFGLDDNIGSDVSIKLMTLDDYVAVNNIEKIDFIKSDVEGHALRSLEGSKMVIRKHSPKMSIASYHYESEANDVIEYVRSINSKYKSKVLGFHTDLGRARPYMVYLWV